MLLPSADEKISWDGSGYLAGRGTRVEAAAGQTSETCGHWSEKKHVEINHKQVEINHEHIDIDQEHVNIGQEHEDIDQKHVDIDQKHVVIDQKHAVVGITSVSEKSFFF